MWAEDHGVPCVLQRPQGMRLRYKIDQFSRQTVLSSVETIRVMFKSHHQKACKDMGYFYFVDAIKIRNFKWAPK